MRTWHDGGHSCRGARREGVSELLCYGLCVRARGDEEEEQEEAVVASGALLRALCVCVCVGGRYVCCWLASVVRADGGFVYGPGRLAACLSQSQGQGQESGGDRDHSTTTR